MTPTEKQPTVFIVDDDPSIRDSLQFLLESVGLEVRTCASAREFLGGAEPLIAVPSMHWL
jgi:FixJ family two-component response regulator